MEHAKTFAGIFDGLKLAYGTYRIDRAAPNGKQQGKAGVVKNPRTPETWEGHLSGKGDAIGIIPINEDNSCKWGCIDVDQYPLDHKELIEKSQNYDNNTFVKSIQKFSKDNKKWFLISQFFPFQ